MIGEQLFIFAIVVSALAGNQSEERSVGYDSSHQRMWDGSGRDQVDRQEVFKQEPLETFEYRDKVIGPLPQTCEQALGLRVERGKHIKIFTVKTEASGFRLAVYKTALTAESTS